MKQFRLAVTGGQGVGKTTFVNRLMSLFNERGVAATRVPSISEVIDKQKHRLGSQAGEGAVLAVCDAHMARALNCYSGRVLVFDRCAADMLAYIELLRVTPDNYNPHFEQLSRVLLRDLDLVCYLSMPAWAIANPAPHEGDEFRGEISDRVRGILNRLDVRHVAIDNNTRAEAEFVGDLVWNDLRDRVKYEN